MKRKTQTVSFRADEETLRLIDQARKAFGISRGDWCRGVIHSELFASKSQVDPDLLSTLHAGHEELADGLGKLNVGLPRVLFVLLTQLGQIDAEQAKEIVRKTLPN